MNAKIKPIPSNSKTLIGNKISILDTSQRKAGIITTIPPSILILIMIIKPNMNKSMNKAKKRGLPKILSNIPPTNISRGFIFHHL
jgi:hypothetical protein